MFGSRHPLTDVTAPPSIQSHCTAALWDLLAIGALVYKSHRQQLRFANTSLMHAPSPRLPQIARCKNYIGIAHFVCVGGGGMLPLRLWDNWPYRFYLSGKWSMKQFKWSLGAPLGNKSEIKFNHFCIKLTANAPRNTHSSSWTWNSSSGDCECQEGDVFVPPMGW